MEPVLLLPGTSLGEGLSERLAEEGFPLADTPGALRVCVLRAGQEPPAEVLGEENVREMASFVLKGGGLLLACDGGAPAASAWPLLNALHLFVQASPRSAEDLGVPTQHPGVRGLIPVALENPCVVSGVGYAWLRIGSDTVALAAPRGAGRVLLCGSVSPFSGRDPAFLLAGLRWISQQTPLSLR